MNKCIPHIRHVTIAAAVLLCEPSFAAVSAEEAKQLGGSVLTLFGAEKAGNKEGTIPPYTGGKIELPATYDRKDPGRHPDPFNEKPLFSITPQNYNKYAEFLTEGHKALFKTYPDYRMDVYPSHRTATFPKEVLDNTAKNATSCTAVDNELKLEGCYGGIPFPIPKTGTQAMWNHLTAYETFAWEAKTSSHLIPPNGPSILQVLSYNPQELPYYDPKRKGVNGKNEIYWKIRVDSLEPARRAGDKLVLIDALDQLNFGRRAWQYIPGQRRVKLAPDLAYDTPSPYTGGASNMDDSKGFTGALDRFDWSLVGKKQVYILYNGFSLQDYKACPDTKLTSTKRFPNPDCVRFELHRTWVVNGKLKPGYRHNYAKRTMYWDEDGHLAGQTEGYDASGKLFRAATVLHMPFYEAIGQTASGTLYMDLTSGIWASNGTGTCDGCGSWVAPPHQAFFYTPDALAGEGIR